MKKRILSIFIVFMLMMPTVLFAGGFTPFKTDPVEPDGFRTPAEQILGAIQVFAFAIALGMLLYLGVKYMMSSADEKANVKQMTINYLIGALIIFGAVGIFKAVLSLVESMK